MAELHTFLAFESSLLQPTTDPAQESILDSVRVAVCASINLFMEINEDEFQRYLQTFVADVWSLLLKITSAPGQVRACWEDTGCGSESGRRGRRSRACGCSAACRSNDRHCRLWRARGHVKGHNFWRRQPVVRGAGAAEPGMLLNLDLESCDYPLITHPKKRWQTACCKHCEHLVGIVCFFGLKLCGRKQKVAAPHQHGRMTQMHEFAPLMSPGPVPKSCSTSTLLLVVDGKDRQRQLGGEENP